VAKSFLHGPVQALFVDAEIHEGLRARAEGTGRSHGGVDFGVIGIEIARGFEVTHAEHAILDGADAVDPPLIVGYRLGELALDRSLRIEAVDYFLGECLVSSHVFAGEDDDARSEAVGAGRSCWSGPGPAARKAAGCVLQW